MSLAGVYDEANIFAKVLRGEAASVKVFEDDAVLAFMDVFPQSQGHLLVVSKTSKARNLLEIEPLALCEVMGAVQRLTRAVVTALRPDGVVVTQFNGAPAGQTVFHLHVHVIPCWSDRPLKGHAQGQMAEIQELARTAAAITAAL